ncbi:MAG: selenide, water dikinase SelD [Synechococcus sp. BS307-5m-G38]|nr:selenide, water dikinase SelD [Synechococcus sp. BS307-5m-G38]
MSSPPGGPLLLAGGGHSHALLLKRWAMRPSLRPNRLIVLVNRNSTALYSGMVPALIAGIDAAEDVAIDLRRLSDRAGVAFVQAEITGLDPVNHRLHLAGRASLSYALLSLDVGAVSKPSCPGIPIKPLEPALSFLAKQDPESATPFRVIGGGAAGVEVVLALRRRWPYRPLRLQTRPHQPSPLERQILHEASVDIVHQPLVGKELPLLCTGSRAPLWLSESGLPVDQDGRLLTDGCLKVEGTDRIFASGDCAVISTAPRPASGVWAVRAANPLAHNLEASCRGRALRRWSPQQHAMQLLGDQQGRAWARRGSWQLGPARLLWHWKRRIDRRFIAGFRQSAPMATGEPMACRGCAAKLPAQPLEAALQQAGLDHPPEDAALIPGHPPLLQSVDGFPALVDDPWLNGRLTALHACSDLWACGAKVHSGQAIVTLPVIKPEEQQELLAQSLAGIQSALREQGATLIGGHTLEARSAPPQPASLGLQLSLCINGRSSKPWNKGGIEAGDVLLLSRPLGTGVLFAAAMAGAGRPQALDTALAAMAQSQHPLLDQLEPHRSSIHACTDVTGFGLLGHLGEMLASSPPLQITLFTETIPTYPDALALLNQGHRSSLAPANRRSWQWLDGPVQLDQSPSEALLELMVDPQTCGPLLLACPTTTAESLMAQGPWIQIGTAATEHG